MVTVFLADDNNNIRKRLVELLGDVDGVEIIGQVADTESAIQGIQSLKPDVVILDIRMPGGNGIQVLDAVRKVDSDVLIIMLTAFPTDQYRVKCHQSGADFFFDKAKDFERVAEIVTIIQDKSHFCEVIIK